MQWKDVSTNWNAYVARIVTRWPALNEAEVQSIDGDQNAFLDQLTKANGGDAVTAQMELADWLMGEEPADVVMDESRDNQRIMESADNVSPGEDVYSDDRKFGDDDSPQPPVAKAS